MRANKYIHAGGCLIIGGEIEVGDGKVDVSEYKMR
jgi:hypothetical protein